MSKLRFEVRSAPGVYWWVLMAADRRVYSISQNFPSERECRDDIDLFKSHVYVADVVSADGGGE